MKPSIKVITGSVRPNRFNIQPAEWIYRLASERPDMMDVELIDLADIALPFLDEPKSPKQQEYTKPHTIKWAKLIEASDGFIFVTPEYNHSLSPVLKNALDFLYFEWNYKPASFISYGTEAGGSRSVEHLRAVCGELKMYDLREQLVISNYWDGLDATGKYQFNEKQHEMAERILGELAYWADVMKRARAEMPLDN